MKVSNNINLTNISQNQIRTLPDVKSDKFDQMLQGASKDTPEKTNALATDSSKQISLTDLTQPSVASSKTPEEIISFATEVLTSEPDIRFEKVNHIKALVDSGNYNIAPEAVAEKLWASGVVRHAW